MNIFEIFRQSYPGTKKGMEVEFENFKKKHPTTWTEVVLILSDRLQYQINAREENKCHGAFVPEWKHLQTWINQKCWEEEITTTKTKTNGINKSNSQKGCSNEQLAGVIIQNFATVQE